MFWYVAPTYTQAKEIVWRDPEMLAQYLPDEIVEKKNETELSIQFKCGSTIILKGADKPDSLRGPNPKGVILDEVYLMKPEVWTEIIAPIAFANPDMWVWFIGTPKPVGKFWEDLYNDAVRRMLAGEKNWFGLTLSADDSGILTPEALEEAKTTMTVQAYEQEFQCKFFGEGGIVFRGLQNVIYGAYEEGNPAHKREWGLDIAKVQDWTVLCAFNRHSYKLDAFDRYNQIDYVLQKARIEAFYRRLGKGRLKMDSTGVGEPIFDDLDKVGLEVEGFNFSEGFKRDLVTNLVIGIEQRKLQLPNIPELVQEFNIFGYEVSKRGRVRYGAPEGFHDDIVMSVALAWWDIGTQLSAFSGPTSTWLANRSATGAGKVGDSE